MCWSTYDPAKTRHECSATALFYAAAERDQERWLNKSVKLSPLWRLEMCQLLNGLGDAAETAHIVVDPLVGEVCVFFRERRPA